MIIRWDHEEHKKEFERELKLVKRPQRSHLNPPKGSGPVCPICGIIAIKLKKYIYGNNKGECCRICKKNKEYIRKQSINRTVDKNYVPPKELIAEVLGEN